MMTDLNLFYEVKSIEERDSEICSIIHLNPHHTIFKAHFPNNPITPGVLLIQIVKELLEEQIGRRIFLNEVTHVKFIKPLIPPAFASFIFKKLIICGNKIDLSAQVEIEGIRYAKMSLSFSYL